MKNNSRKPTIYWDNLREGYNDQNNATYETVKEFIRKAYLKHLTIEKTSMVLGISGYALWRKMQVLKIARLPKGHRGPCRSLQTIRHLGNVSQMTAAEIARTTGLNRGWITVLLKRHNIPYAKGIRREAGTWNRVKPLTIKD